MGSGGSGGAVNVGDSVLMHHRTLDRAGVYVQPALSKAAVATLHKDPAFTAAFPPVMVNGQPQTQAVYAQPLFVDGGMGGQDLVLVVTNFDNVYALDGATGALVWSANVGAPTPLATLPCGNVDPFGIVGTPVIDLASRTLFLDAEILLGANNPTHQIFALSIDTGAVKAGWPVDVPTNAKSGMTTFQPSTQGERGALTIVNGRVYVPFGGRFGDCSPYHGWVVGIDVANPAQVTAWATAGMAGGTWMTGGIASDGTNLFVSTGNTQGANSWSGGDAVIRLSASLAMSDYFAPKNWLNLDNGDLDLGTGPVLFDLAGSTPSALTIAFGKDGNAYLLDRNSLGSVGAALGANAAKCTANNNTGACSSLAGVTTNEVITAPAVYTTPTATRVAFRGNGGKCTSGSGDLTTLTIVPGAPPTLAASWCAAGGAGSPIVTTTDGHAEAIVWTLGAEFDGHLHAFDGDTGQAITFTDSNLSLPGMRRFNTPIAAKGRLFVPVDGGVVAFKL